MKLHVRPTHDTYNGTAAEAVIGIDQGKLYVDTKNDALADELRRMLANELFIAGHGYAKLRRDPITNALVRTPDTGRTELERWVRLDDTHPDDVLAAIADNLELTKQFDTTVLR